MLEAEPEVEMPQLLLPASALPVVNLQRHRAVRAEPEVGSNPCPNPLMLEAGLEVGMQQLLLPASALAAVDRRRSFGVLAWEAENL